MNTAPTEWNTYLEDSTYDTAMPFVLAFVLLLAVYLLLSLLRHAIRYRQLQFWHYPLLFFTPLAVVFTIGYWMALAIGPDAGTAGLPESIVRSVNTTWPLPLSGIFILEIVAYYLGRRAFRSNPREAQRTCVLVYLANAIVVVPIVTLIFVAYTSPAV